jgi:nitroimidazol reductase NimA-like FMN-containing flavoprotein (pyridoxamine 5'-phosphate oxidase superfamily)
MTDDPRSHVTRHDRAIQDEAWIAAFLDAAGMASISTVSDGQPYLSTLLFWYDAGAHAIYFHTARRGRVWENLRGGGPVCLSAARMGRLLPAKNALNFSVEYESVVVFGSAHLVEDNEEAARALQGLLDKYFAHLHPGADYRPITAEELAATAVFRMTIESWSAKRKAVADDFPGAFQWNPAS